MESVLLLELPTLLSVATICAAFLAKNLISHFNPIWSTVTVSKHPYDFGDRVVIEDRELIIAKVWPLYTVSNRRSNRAIGQIAHNEICN
ncbi:unnamed protein product [Periconia digitata]|uniref:Uncharacterized protein n=1 Tax=Periconia digitata TaxID=1303443 RepID=A0A9W4ULT9_9PLEO|nr:unnamed protein product [Periconia digitata]